MIVVDIGCYRHPSHQGASQDSIARLIDRFHPVTLYGFDPHPGQSVASVMVGRCRVITQQLAAWTYTGRVPYHRSLTAPLSSRVAVGADPTETVACFDLAPWLAGLPDGERVVLKLDAEGAEYPLLRRLVDLRVDARLHLLLVEWHDLPDRAAERDALTALLRCPVEPWD